jgi:hypothetical protein
MFSFFIRSGSVHPAETTESSRILNGCQESDIFVKVGLSRLELSIE